VVSRLRDASAASRSHSATALSATATPARAARHPFGRSFSLARSAQFGLLLADVLLSPTQTLFGRTGLRVDGRSERGLAVR
jgi:hypothetical protein